MKLLSAKIRGSIGLKKGIGIENISLDLSNLSGLIALDGENGRGKSTFLESLSPYPVMPSRKGALQHQFFLKDSCLDREYLYNGDRIRCLVKINGGSNYSPEGFVWINDQPKVEGKISSYKELIAEIFGSQQLFYNSAFCSQGSENLNDLDPADLKNLFAEFLQLHKYLKWEEIAKGCGKILDGKLAAIDTTISLLESKKDGNTITFLTDEAIPAANAEKEKAEKGAAVLTEKIKGQTENLEAEKKKITENEKLEARAKDIKNSLEQTLRDIESEGYQSMKELGAVREKAQGIISQIKQHEEILKDKESIGKAVSGLEAKNNEARQLRAVLTSPMKPYKTYLQKYQILKSNTER
jgi:DNA repair exonuclease SbcCD ATPase subunit